MSDEYLIAISELESYQNWTTKVSDKKHPTCVGCLARKPNKFQIMVNIQPILKILYLDAGCQKKFCQLSLENLETEPVHSSSL